MLPAPPGRNTSEKCHFHSYRVGSSEVRAPRRCHSNNQAAFCRNIATHASVSSSSPSACSEGGVPAGFTAARAEARDQTGPASGGSGLVAIANDDLKLASQAMKLSNSSWESILSQGMCPLGHGTDMAGAGQSSGTVSVSSLIRASGSFRGCFLTPSRRLRLDPDRRATKASVTSSMVCSTHAFAISISWAKLPSYTNPIQGTYISTSVNPHSWGTVAALACACEARAAVSCFNLNQITFMDCKKHSSSNSPFIKVNEGSMYRDMGLAPAQNLRYTHRAPEKAKFAMLQLISGVETYSFPSVRTREMSQRVFLNLVKKDHSDLT